MRIIDPKGVWFTNTGRFPIHDPQTNTTLPPGELVQAIYSDWAKGQPMIVLDLERSTAPAEKPAAPSKKA